MALCKPLLSVHVVLVLSVLTLNSLDLNIRPTVRQGKRIDSVLNIQTERGAPCVFSDPSLP